MTLTAENRDDLLERFVAGDPGAFVQFYRRHLSAVLAFFLRRTGDPELTADLTADVVPDGVASVTLHYPASRGEPALSVSAGVVANVYAVSVARASTVPAPEVTWRSADGAALKTIKRP